MLLLLAKLDGVKLASLAVPPDNENLKSSLTSAVDAPVAVYTGSLNVTSISELSALSLTVDISGETSLSNHLLVNVL